MQSSVLRSLLVVCLVSGIHAVKRYQDVMTLGRQSANQGHHNQIRDWAPESNYWDEKLYPSWKTDDPRWDNCWKGGKVVALLTSDSPALVGSNVTFAVTLQFPRCQKEDENGDIIYEKNCLNESSGYQDQYVYNWTKWIEYCDEGNCSYNNKFPDGRPFPHHHNWRRHNFIYIFKTLGQYYQQIGRSSAILSINTTNITVGAQMMEVSVYRRGHRQHYPVAKASGMYVVTDQIPFYVNISQKNDRNSSDNIFIKDSPITFDIKLHDPSHYLNKSIVSFNWNFGDGSGAFVSNNPVTGHTYTLIGNFSLNLTIKAAIPGPCKPVTSTLYTPTSSATVVSTNPSATVALTTQNTTTGNVTDEPTTETTATFHTETPNTTIPQTTTVVYTTTAAAGCFTYRYGYYKANITIVDGILEVNIIEMTNVQVSTSEAESSLIDFIVSCEGSIPTDACTVISDSTCMVPQNVVCDPVPASDQCLVTLRRAFEPGTYCVNITLSDNASLGLASTLVSVSGSNNHNTLQAVLVPFGLVTLVAIVIGAVLYRKYKEYKPIENAADQSDQGPKVYYRQIKEAFFRGNDESNPLLKPKAGII